MEAIALLLDIVLIALLGLVIYFITRLHSRLEIVRSGKDDLENLLRDLVNTTGRAEQNLSSLRLRAEDLTETLGKQVTGATNAREEMSYLLASADRTAADLIKLVEQAKSAAPIPAASVVKAAAATVSAKPAVANTSTEKADPRKQAEQDLMKAIEKLR
ncbi:MAG: DUF6468 domain-containing protein [Bdellovibrionales bacterium]